MNRLLQAGLDYRPVLTFELGRDTRRQGQQLLAHRHQNADERFLEHLDRHRLAPRLLQFEFRRGGLCNDQALAGCVQRPECDRFFESLLGLDAVGSVLPVQVADVPGHARAKVILAVPLPRHPALD